MTQNCVQRTVYLPIPFVPLTPLLRPSLHKAWKRSVEGENGVPPKGLWQQATSVYTGSTRSLFTKPQNKDVLFDVPVNEQILSREKPTIVSIVKKKKKNELLIHGQSTRDWTPLFFFSLSYCLLTTLTRTVRSSPQSQNYEHLATEHPTRRRSLAATTYYV